MVLAHGPEEPGTGLGVVMGHAEHVPWRGTETSVHPIGPPCSPAPALPRGLPQGPAPHPPPLAGEGAEGLTSHQLLMGSAIPYSLKISGSGFTLGFSLPRNFLRGLRSSGAPHILPQPVLNSYAPPLFAHLQPIFLEFLQLSSDTASQPSPSICCMFWHLAGNL